MKKVLLLGATGSIGQQTVELIEQFDQAFKLIGVSALHRVDDILDIVDRHGCQLVGLHRDYEALVKAHDESLVFYDADHLEKLIEAVDDDVIVVNALVGSVGLVPTIAALEKGLTVLLANKETLVVGGEIISALLPKVKGRLVPIDSEHSGIAQCLMGSDMSDVEKVVITASGGSFRDVPLEDLNAVTIEDALAHPNWSMGDKITIDSATMMNKVFEVIEAHYLFGLPYNQIEAVYHRESVVHGMVHYKDGNVLMHAGPADMRIPILTALEGKERLPYRTIFDITRVKSLSFEVLDKKRYSLFDLGIAVAKRKGLHTVVMNAANEEAVRLFLDGRVPFLEIEKIIVDCLTAFDNGYKVDVKTIMLLDKKVRSYVKNKYMDGE